MLKVLSYLAHLFADSLKFYLTENSDIQALKSSKSNEILDIGPWGGGVV